MTMREGVWSLLAVLAVTSRACIAGAAALPLDRFNLYKETIRSPPDEPAGLAAPDRTLYLYRVPLQMYQAPPPAAGTDDRKRNGNFFKNHMLSRQQAYEEVPALKRSSKMALSILMANKQLPNANVEIVPSEVGDAIQPYEMKNAY